MSKSFLIFLVLTVVPLTTQNVLGKLDIVGNTTSWFYDDTFNIAGEIRNNGTSDVDFVKVTATLYNAAGTVIGTDFNVRDVGEIDTYKVDVSG
jgi:hypothetical protein